MQALIEQSDPGSALLNTRDALGNTPLHHAVQAALAPKRPVVVNLLLAAGAEVDPANATGTTPLHLATSGDSALLAQILLAAGANPHSADSWGWSPRMIADRTTNAALKRVYRLREQRGEPLDDAALFAAIRADNETRLVDALDAGVDPNRRTAAGVSALQLASDLGQWQIAATLLDRGADSQAPGNDALVATLAAAGRSDLLGRVVAVNNIEAADAAGLRPLHHAVLGRCAACIDTLLAAGADANAASGDGEAPLLFASRRGELPALSALLAGGADARRADPQGKTALWWASHRQSLPAVNALLERNGGFGKDGAGRTALHVAALQPNIEVLNALLAAAPVAAVDAHTLDGSTPLMLAASRGNLAAVNALLGRGSEVDAAAHNGDTALLLAVRADELAVAQRLIEADASLHRRNALRDSAARLISAKSQTEWDALLEGRTGLAALF